MALKITINQTVRIVDEDSNNTGCIIAFDCEAGINVANPTPVGTNQITNNARSAFLVLFSNNS